MYGLIKKVQYVEYGRKFTFKKWPGFIQRDFFFFTLSQSLLCTETIIYVDSALSGWLASLHPVAKGALSFPLIGLKVFEFSQDW